MRKHWSVILACGAAILLAWPVSAQAPSTHPHTAPGSTGSPAKPKSSAQPKVSDAQLEATIRAKFAKSKSANKFKVHVQGGVATIEGNTEVVQHKAAATRMAKVAGAVAVNNKVVVSDAAKQKAAGNLEEGRRRVQVKRSEARSQP
ncbi:MAG TPA: BON domain-containing protein [Candidatus Acidoferrales bacterium]|nr:BON domain-containing protein [Candidatus Acidoferrales bacterium]